MEMATHTKQLSSRTTFDMYSFQHHSALVSPHACQSILYSSIPANARQHDSTAYIYYGFVVRLYASQPQYNDIASVLLSLTDLSLCCMVLFCLVLNLTFFRRCCVFSDWLWERHSRTYEFPLNFFRSEMKFGLLQDVRRNFKHISHSKQKNKNIRTVIEGQSQYIANIN